jgi:hypothetical protein
MDGCRNEQSKNELVKEWTAKSTMMLNLQNLEAADCDRDDIRASPEMPIKMPCESCRNSDVLVGCEAEGWSTYEIMRTR